MSHIQVEIYILIMLECRIPLEEASKVFRIPKEVLAEEINTKASHEVYRWPLEYLEVECSRYPEEIAKGKWKAELYLRRLRKILKVQDKAERVRLLNEFITTLAGPSITFAITKCSRYTEEEKTAILKYRIKYAIPGNEMKRGYLVDKDSLIRWENDLPEGELKTRCNILREYLTDKHSISKKHRYANYIRSRSVKNGNE